MYSIASNLTFFNTSDIHSRYAEHT